MTHIWEFQASKSAVLQEQDVMLSAQRTYTRTAAKGTQPMLLMKRPRVHEDTCNTVDCDVLTWSSDTSTAALHKHSALDPPSIF